MYTGGMLRRRSLRQRRCMSTILTFSTAYYPTIRASAIPKLIVSHHPDLLGASPQAGDSQEGTASTSLQPVFQPCGALVVPLLVSVYTRLVVLLQTRQIIRNFNK